MAEILFVNCSCDNEFQDKHYGKKVRAATPVNKTRKSGKLTEVRCTVCGKEHNKFFER